MALTPYYHARRAVRMSRNVVLKKEVKAFIWGCESLLAAVESGSEFSLEELSRVAVEPHFLSERNTFPAAHPLALEYDDPAQDVRPSCSWMVWIGPWSNRSDHETSFHQK